MKTAQQDLTQGPLEKQIMLFSIPLVLSNVLQVLFNMADVAVVGRHELVQGLYVVDVQFADAAASGIAGEKLERICPYR